MGGSNSNVTVEGLLGRRCGDLVLAQAEERRKVLGTSPLDMDFKTTRAREHPLTIAHSVTNNLLQKSTSLYNYRHVLQQNLQFNNSQSNSFLAVDAVSDLTSPERH